MGTGHLNVLRAYQQFSAGQWKPQNPVPTMGWDYETVTKDKYQEYVISQPLPENSFVSITLVWDRLVELNDKNKNEQYDVGENFEDRGLNNLDLYLMPVNANNTSESICRSVSKVDNTEHIFCPVSATGNYKIRVQYKQQVNQGSQPYGLAWWTVGKSAP